MGATVDFKVRCDVDLAQEVGAAVAAWKAIEEQWWGQANETLIGLPAKEFATRQRCVSPPRTPSSSMKRRHHSPWSS